MPQGRRSPFLLSSIFQIPNLPPSACAVPEEGPDGHLNAGLDQGRLELPHKNCRGTRVEIPDDTSSDIRTIPRARAQAPRPVPLTRSRSEMVAVATPAKDGLVEIGPRDRCIEYHPRVQSKRRRAVRPL
jgi:hypothetical protein